MSRKTSLQNAKQVTEESQESKASPIQDQFKDPGKIAGVLAGMSLLVVFVSSVASIGLAIGTFAKLGFSPSVLSVKTALDMFTAPGYLLGLAILFSISSSLFFFKRPLSRTFANFSVGVSYLVAILLSWWAIRLTEHTNQTQIATFLVFMSLGILCSTIGVMYSSREARRWWYISMLEVCSVFMLGFAMEACFFGMVFAADESENDNRFHLEGPAANYWDQRRKF
jgi:hypothetical protein